MDNGNSIEDPCSSVAGHFLYLPPAFGHRVAIHVRRYAVTLPWEVSPVTEGDRAALAAAGITCGYFDDMRPLLEAHGIHVGALEPATDLAWACHRLMCRVASPCLRCGVMGPAAHDPRCQTAAGMPLFPYMTPDRWRGEIIRGERSWGIITVGWDPEDDEQEDAEDAEAEDEEEEEEDEEDAEAEDEEDAEDSLLEHAAYEGYLESGRWYRVTLPHGETIVAGSYYDSVRQLTVLYWLGAYDSAILEQYGVKMERRDALIPQLVLLGVQVGDFTPADDLAVDAWFLLQRDAVPCPRCGASDPTVHLATCHTAAGIPLYPTVSQEVWLRDVMRDSVALDAWHTYERQILLAKGDLSPADCEWSAADNEAASVRRLRYAVLYGRWME